MLTVAQRGMAEQMALHAIAELDKAVDSVRKVEEYIEDSAVHFVTNPAVDRLQLLVANSLSLVSKGQQLESLSKPSLDIANALNPPGLNNSVSVDDAHGAIRQQTCRGELLT